MSRFIAMAAVALMLCAPLPVLSQSDGEGGLPSDEELDDAARTVRDAIASTLRTVQQFLDTIPRYEAPEILDNGDIIIRRILPKPELDDDLYEQIPTSAPGRPESDEILPKFRPIAVKI